MKKREAQFTLLFRAWLKSKPFHSATLELKQTQSDSIPFNAVKPHQIHALLASQSERGLLYKIPDDSRGIKPCDMVYLQNVTGYVVIKYPKLFVLIKVDSFIKEQESSPRKSLTVTRACEMAYKVIHTCHD